MRIAINGFGRIGRNVLRAIYEYSHFSEVKVVAINDLAPLDSNIHLLKYDSTHGRLSAKVSENESSFTINGDEVLVYSNRNPEELPWAELNIDLVFECTGFFRSNEKASLHLKAGAKKVLVSAPGKGLEKTIVYGVNDHELSSEHLLVSNASCTTNCLAHVAKALNDSVGIVSGLANTVHAYTNTQNLLDSFHKDKRRGRAAANSMIPTSTGSAKAIGDVIPELDGKLDAVAVRVPTMNVSLLDFTFVPGQAVTETALRKILDDYAMTRQSIFEVSDEPLVSCDFNHHPASCVVDFPQTRLADGLIKIQAWYDNEWGFSNRMLDTGLAMHNA